MEFPFIVNKSLTDTISGIRHEAGRVNVYGPDEAKRLMRIVDKLVKLVNAETDDDEDFRQQYPEHAKQDKVRDQAQAIGEFIEHGGWILCKWPEGESHPRPTNFSINQVLADYFEIDLRKLEDEKQRMLAALAAPKKESL